MTEYATAITFPQTSTTYEAFSKLSAAASQYGVRSAGIIERDAQGQLRVPESGDAAAGIGTACSLIGMLVGVLGGPIGMLLGWGVGAASGALYDAERLDTGDEAIAAFGRLIPPGGNAILAVTDEVTTDPLEQFAAGFGGRFPAGRWTRFSLSWRRRMRPRGRLTRPPEKRYASRRSGSGGRLPDASGRVESKVQ